MELSSILSGISDAGAANAATGNAPISNDAIRSIAKILFFVSIILSTTFL